MRGIGLGTLLLIAFIVVFPWAIGSMVAGMGGGSTASSSGSGASSATTPPVSSVGTTMSQLGQTDVAVFMLFAVILLEVPFFFRSRKRLFWQLVLLGASVLAALLAIIVAYGLSTLSLPAIGLEISGGLIVSIIIVVGLAVAGSVTAALLLSKKVNKVPLMETPLAPPRDKRKVVWSAYGTDYVTPAATGYRATVFSCYSSFCSILAKLGIGNPPSRTPRELASEASRRTSFDRDMVKRLTALFEKARYSREEISAEDADESTRILGNVREEAGRS